MKRLTYYLCGILLLLVGIMPLSAQSQYKDTLVVARDGSGDYRTLTEAMEGIRAFMDYKVTVLIKNGTYKEKAIIPSWVQNVDFIGESVENTIITYDDHANINKMGTFRTYTVKVQGNNITFKNLTIENNAARLGQAVALHTEGDKLVFINCRLLGNQDTIYTGAAGTRLYFVDCYIEGTTDFIFGPSTALFEDCIIHSKRNSYVTAASTPKEAKYGYVFKHCKLPIRVWTRFIWGVPGVRMLPPYLSIVKWVSIFVPKDGITGEKRKMRRQPAMLSTIVQEKVLRQPVG